MVDLLIKDGRVVDGTGQTWFRASIAVSGDTVQIVRGDSSAIEAPRVIDASRYVVCPGFIDMHSHSDLMMLSDPRHEAKMRQGVTTEALGMDGLSYAPSSPNNLEHLLTYLAAVNGTPPPSVRWSSVAEFLDLLDGKAACNVVYFVPHAAIRVEAMGWEDRLPTPQELARMQDLARQGMRDGAFGFSTGLTYPPGAYSDTDELVAVSQAVGEYGGFYITHARYTLGDRLLDPFREAVETGRRSGVPVHLSHYHSPVDGMGLRMLDLVDESRNSGVDVTFDQYPYAAASTLLHSLLPYWVHAGGPPALLERIQTREVRERIGDSVNPMWGLSLDYYIFSGVPVHLSHYHSPVDGMGLRMLDLVDESRNSGVDVTFDQYPYAAASTLLHSLLPYWVHAGGPPALLERIQTREVRERIGDSVNPMWGLSLDYYIFSHLGSDKNKEWEGRSLVDLARAQGKSMVDTICDLLIEENLEVAFVARTGNPDNIRTIVKHPAHMVGSDGLLTGEMPNPRSYGTFPYVLGQFVREEGLLRLEEAVRKMTSIPAQRLGLSDRGILRDGMKADIVMFDPDRVRALATFEEPKQFPEGIDYVLVNGQAVIDNGTHTGAVPGRALRSQ